MIDSLYQDAINKTLDDQVRRPGSVAPPAGPSTFAGFWRGLGGIPGGVSQGFGTAADVLQGTALVDASQGLVYNPATRSYTQLPMDDSSRGLQKTIKSGRIADLFTSDTGDTFRTVAKDYMPDPQTTGAATQILGHGLNFLTQAGTTMAVAGPVLGPVGVGAAAGMQEADKLREEGVDQRTRTQAGAAAGLGAGASMVLPMSGANWWVRAAKGAAGGAGTSAAQNEAEKLILEHAGYDKVASQYDPLDPTSLLISAAVPAVLGATLGHTPSGKVREPNAADVGLTPGEQAHSDAVENSLLDSNIADLHQELAKQTDPVAKAVLQTELDKLTARKAAGEVAGAPPMDPNLEAAARVQQTARALDESRLTPDDDMAGHDQHQQAIERAADQLGAGDPVDVMPVFGDSLFDSMRQSRALADRIDFLENQRAQLLGDAGGLLEPGEASALHAQVADLQSQLTDTSAAAVKARAEELQGPGVSYKQASAKAQRELSARLADQQSTIERLQDQLATHAAAAQASEHISFVERDLSAARERADGVPGPKTSPRRLAIAVANAVREMREAEPAPRANPEAFHAAARAEAETPAAGGEAKAPESGSKTVPREATAAKPAPTLGGPSDMHLDAAVSQLDPEMLVHMDGMPGAVRLGDLMDSVRAEAAESARDSKLLEVAAQCAISVGTAG